MLVTRERPLGVGAGVALDADVDADGGVARPVTDGFCVCPFFGMGVRVPYEEGKEDLSDWLLRRLGIDGETLVFLCVSNSLLESKDGARAGLSRCGRAMENARARDGSGTPSTWVPGWETP